MTDQHTDPAEMTALIDPLHPDLDYLRAALAAPPAPDCQQPGLVTAGGGQDAQPVAVKVKPLDFSHILRHAFLAGFVAAREIPAGDECDGTVSWLDFDPTVNPAYNRILAALDVQPITVQDAALVPEIAALIEGWDNLISEAEMLLSEDAAEHADGSERTDLWDYNVFVGIDTAKATLAALRAIVEGQA